MILLRLLISGPVEEFEFDLLALQVHRNVSEQQQHLLWGDEGEGTNLPRLGGDAEEADWNAAEMFILPEQDRGKDAGWYVLHLARSDMRKFFRYGSGPPRTFQRTSSFFSSFPDGSGSAVNRAPSVMALRFGSSSMESDSGLFLLAILGVEGLNVRLVSHRCEKKSLVPCLALTLRVNGPRSHQFLSEAVVPCPKALSWSSFPRRSKTETIETQLNKETHHDKGD